MKVIVIGLFAAVMALSVPALAGNHGGGGHGGPGGPGGGGPVTVEPSGTGHSDYYSGGSTFSESVGGSVSYGYDGHISYAENKTSGESKTNYVGLNTPVGGLVVGDSESEGKSTSFSECQGEDCYSGAGGDYASDADSWGVGFSELDFSW